MWALTYRGFRTRDASVSQWTWRAAPGRDRARKEGGGSSPRPADAAGHAGRPASVPEGWLPEASRPRLVPAPRGDPAGLRAAAGRRALGRGASNGQPARPGHGAPAAARRPARSAVPAHVPRTRPPRPPRPTPALTVSRPRPTAPLL